MQHMHPPLQQLYLQQIQQRQQQFLASALSGTSLDVRVYLDQQDRDVVKHSGDAAIAVKHRAQMRKSSVAYAACRAGFSVEVAAL
jgi:hypothetical protein